MLVELLNVPKPLFLSKQGSFHLRTRPVEIGQGKNSYPKLREEEDSRCEHGNRTCSWSFTLNQTEVRTGLLLGLGVTEVLPVGMSQLVGLLWLY